MLHSMKYKINLFFVVGNIKQFYNYESLLFSFYVESAIFRPFWEQAGAQNAPSAPPFPPKKSPKCYPAKCGKHSAAALEATCDPKRPRVPFLSILVRFLMDLGPMFGGFLQTFGVLGIDFRWIFGKCWTHEKRPRAHFYGCWYDLGWIWDGLLMIC